MNQLDQRFTGSAPGNYERYLVPAYFAAFAENLVNRAAVGPGDHVLDMACGTGIVGRSATSLVGYTGKVVGLDVAPGMLEIARSRSLPPNARVEIEWQEGDVVNMPFGDGSFHVVICQQGIQFFSDPSSALSEVKRVLSPGGRIAFSVWRPIQYSPGFLVLAEALGRHIGKEVGDMIKTLFSFDPERIRSLITEAGFKEPRILIDVGTARFPSCEEFVRKWIVSSRYSGPFGQASDEARKAVIRDVSLSLDSSLDDDGLIFPMETYIVLAHS